MIGEKGNIFAIGRSGTGKTTCALLRLFSTEILFKVRSSFASKAILQGTKFTSDDVDSTSGLHSIFVTASPVLTNEVRRYYEKLKEKIKIELLKKDKKRDANAPEVIEATEIEETNIVDEKTSASLEQVFGNLKGTEGELEMLDEGEIEKQLNLGHSLNSVRDDQFPLFLTIRRLLMMIDATLMSPFFVRDEKKRIIGLGESAEWHDEESGVMMINSTHKFSGLDPSTEEQLETEDQKELVNVLEKVDGKEGEVEIGTENIIEGDKKSQPVMSREVNFNVFCNKFWPTIHGKIQFKGKVITEAAAWREIQTYIKGNVESYKYFEHKISHTIYLQNMNGLKAFGQKLENKMYFIFLKYRAWCYKNNYFDMADLVNYILSKIDSQRNYRIPIHFIMCDEVQDLSPATLLLLMKITDQSLFFSGDTAQTISRGADFRFSDLERLFKKMNLPIGAPVIKQLTSNFRSHGRILDLANSIIRVLELLYPDSIDKLGKENSPLDGMKPVVLDSTLQNNLLNLLLFSQNSATGADRELLKKSPIEFGCDQVIIVRNQQAKKDLPGFLRHALCLTVYEAKGLEFDDVILYNFFMDSEVKDEWKLINRLVVTDMKVKKTGEELKEEYETVKNVGMETIPGSLKTRYVGIISELKHLYTAITRPKKRLFIFDEDTETRAPILNYWLALGYVNVITENQLVDTNESSSIKQLIETLSGRNASKVGWRAQGIKMFRRKYYEQAVKCFENSGDEKLQIQAEGYFKATRATEVLAEIDSIKYEFSEENHNKPEKKAYNDKITSLTSEAWSLFNQAGKTFEKLGLQAKAAQCYFTVQEFEKAAHCFEAAGSLGQAAEAYMKLGNYLGAGELYEKAKAPLNAIMAYENVKRYDKVLNCLHEFKSEFKESDRLKLAKKYMELELQNVFKEYEEASTINENERKALPIIEERLAEQLSYEHDIEKEDKIEQTEEVKDKKEGDILETSTVTNPFEEVDKSKVSDANNPFEEINTSKVSNPFEELNATEESKKGLEANNKSGFSVIEANSEENANNAHVDIEHISGLDPDDEWLKCETGSIIDSVISGDIVSNRDSDYSMLDNAHAFVMNSSLLNTKRDIFIEDMTMSKIIKYLSYFSDEVRTHLESNRSKAAFLHTKTDPKAINTSSNLIIDMDEIDLPFVHLLLDTLETFELYKLCIVICNRYQINGRIGRYVAAIGQRYSNLKSICASFSKYIEVSKNFNLVMQRNNALIANKAVHGVLEVVNPAYLKLKKYGEMIDETNSLGGYCYRSMMLLGYWKKLVYIMDCQNSLAIASAFADYANYKIIYLINFGNITKENAPRVQTLAKSCSFEWLPFNSPSNSIERQAAILALDSVIFELNKVCSITYAHDEAASIQINECLKFPPEFPCNAALWKYLLSNKEEDLNGIYSGFDLGAKNFLSISNSNKPVSELAIWDFCVGLMQLIFGTANLSIQKIFLKYPSASYNNLLQAIYLILEFLRSKRIYKVYSEHHYTAYLAILSAFGIRKIGGRDCRLGYGRFFIIHRSSIHFSMLAKIAQSILEKARTDLNIKATNYVNSYVRLTNKYLFNEVLREVLNGMRKEEKACIFCLQYLALKEEANFYFADLEIDYAFIAPELLLESIVNKIVI